MLFLTVLNTESNFRRVALTRTVTVGRSRGCELRVANAKVSRRHCQLIVTDDVVRVRDLGSSNKTYVNGKPLLPNVSVDLEEGDELLVGSVRFRVHKEEPRTQYRGPEATDERRGSDDLSDSEAGGEKVAGAAAIAAAVAEATVMMDAGDDQDFEFAAIADESSSVADDASRNDEALADETQSDEEMADAVPDDDSGDSYEMDDLAFEADADDVSDFDRGATDVGPAESGEFESGAFDSSRFDEDESVGEDDSPATLPFADSSNEDADAAPDPLQTQEFDDSAFVEPPAAAGATSPMGEDESSVELAVVDFDSLDEEVDEELVAASADTDELASSGSADESDGEVDEAGEVDVDDDSILDFLNDDED